MYTDVHFWLLAMQMFGGWNKKYKHQSDTLGCSMTFTVYYPPAAEKGKVPVSCAIPSDCMPHRYLGQNTP